MNSYQKLKKKHADEISRLHADIRTLLKDANSHESSAIRLKYQMYDAVWIGRPTLSEKMNEVGYGLGLIGVVEHYEQDKTQ